MRRLPVSLALLLMAAPVAAEEGAKPEINRPYVVDTDVARWNRTFENERREVYVKRDEIVAAAGAKPGMTVADIGAGTGLFTMLFADAVKPGGSVYAVDISQAFVDYIQETAKKRRVRNVTAVLTDGTDVKLPEGSVDLAYLSDVYHHFEHPAETLASIRKALKPGGRMVVVDYERIPGVTPAARVAHVRLDKRTAISEIEAAGFSLLEEKKKLMRQNYFLVFAKSPTQN
ncbi:MAG TPA: methyltransferase domain-containing protein [Burkholderiales bacterium]|nr:methyltransferase domain-containing protein [Burkholderiales bacterium]